MTGRKFFMAVLILVISAAMPCHAQATDYLQQWFPSIFGAPDAGPRPEKTLQAPFADAPAPAPGQPDAVQGLYNPATVTETADLAVPHREEREIGDWLIRAVSEILALNPNTYAIHVKHLATGMDATAMANFQAFLQQSNVLKTLVDNKLSMHCFVEEQPLLLNKGAVDGRYRWLFEMPVTLTFLSTGTRSYEQATGVNQHVIIRVQVGRVGRGQGIDELMIESFDVRQNPDEK